MFLLALTIALLPLRGWLGDAMAMQQMAQALEPTQVSAAPGDCHQALGHQDQAHHDTPANAQDAAHTSGDCGGCTSCQICHSVALAVFTPWASMAAPGASAPQTQAKLHASVERAPGFKPPIS